MLDLLLDTPPKIAVDFVFTITLSGTKMSIPPNILIALIITSLFIFASLKSNLSPPKTAVKFVPLNSSLLKLMFCDENVEAYSPKSFWFLFNSFTFSFTFPLMVSLKIIESPIITSIAGNKSFHIRLKSIMSWHARSKAIPINTPIILPVLSSSVNKFIKHGMIINKVHHPSKNTSICAIPCCI